MRLYVSIRVEPENDEYNVMSGNLSVNQEVKIKASDFLEVCKIIGQFNTLAKDIQERR